ncbi:hypothetical protein [Mycobacterium sp.]|uniref:hypothetical protein n=1 Tax=Mycobacterium sp. TaxID=1785 RepID=UPI002B52D808|nr:hypothetical protein [Mycobacterium sp.]HTQ19830.1 hypothetical protein [Mycobacterium sp.]
MEQQQKQANRTKVRPGGRLGRSSSPGQNAKIVAAITAAKRRHSRFCSFEGFVFSRRGPVQRADLHINIAELLDLRGERRRRHVVATIDPRRLLAAQ